MITIISNGLTFLVFIGYTLLTMIFLSDWERLTLTNQLNNFQLSLHCLLSGGGLSAIFAVFSLFKKKYYLAIALSVFWPIEILLSYVFIIMGFYYWTFLKVCLFTLFLFCFKRCQNQPLKTNSIQRS